MIWQHFSEKPGNHDQVWQHIGRTMRILLTLHFNLEATDKVFNSLFIPSERGMSVINGVYRPAKATDDGTLNMEV